MMVKAIEKPLDQKIKLKVYKFCFIQNSLKEFSSWSVHGDDPEMEKLHEHTLNL